MAFVAVKKKGEYPTLYMVVGIPFSEKEEIADNLCREFTPLTFADNNLHRNVLTSIFNHEIPEALDTPEKICAFINKEARKALREGREVLIRHSLAEKEVYRKAMMQGLDAYRKIAVFADTPMDICKARQKRGNSEEKALDLTKLKKGIEVPSTKEGFDHVDRNRKTLIY